MAAAMVAGNQGKTPGETQDDHTHRVPKVNDPVVLRTCTVDEAFRRMEELVGSEEEEKNWKGIVIALLVIGFILGMIALAIILVTPAPKKYDPGEPMPFSLITDKSLQLKKPVFSWVRGSNQYVEYIEQELNTSDKFVERRVVLTSINEGFKTETIIPQQVISSDLRGLESVTVPPTAYFSLVKLNSETNSISTYSKYIVYDKQDARLIDVDEEKGKLQFATWIGNKDQLIFVKDNNIYYRINPYREPFAVTTDGSSSILNGVADKIYKVYIFPTRESLIWPSPADDKFIFAKISTGSISYSTGPTPNRLSTKMAETGNVTLHVYNPGDMAPPTQLQLPSGNGYLTAVSWMDSERVMVVWLYPDHQKEHYIICNAITSICQTNFEYTSAEEDLSWVGMYGTPVYNPLMNEYYIILPDPANEKKLYRHIAAVKVSAGERRYPEMTFITEHPWSDTEILGTNGSVLYFLSTGLNYTHQHLFGVDVTNGKESCLTCKKTVEDVGTDTLYVEAEFGYEYTDVFLSVLGADFPIYMITPTDDLLQGYDEIAGTEVGEAHRKALELAYTDVYLPRIEYVTVPLDDGNEASVKLIMPAIFDREKTCTYELIVIVNNIPGSRIATQKFSLGFHDYLAKNETYVLALVDVRGSGGQGEVLRQAVNGKLGEAEGYDISTVIQFLTSHEEIYRVNKDYVAVWGKDYGGFISLHAVTKNTTHCGIVSSPITSLAQYGGWLTDRYMRTERNTTELLYECEDSTDKCSIPEAKSILLIHGIDDAVVPVKNSMNLMRKLQLAGYNFKQQIYPGIGNDLESTDVADHYYQTVSNYLSECFEIKARLDNSKLDHCQNR